MPIIEPSVGAMSPAISRGVLRVRGAHGSDGLALCGGLGDRASLLLFSSDGIVREQLRRDVLERTEKHPPAGGVEVVI